MKNQSQLLEVKDLVSLAQYSQTRYWNVIDFFKDQHCENQQDKIIEEFSFFKKGILPIWEDQNNQKGSSYYFFLDLDLYPRAQDIWEHLLCEFISDTFQFNYCINGLRIVDRIKKSKSVKIEIWLKFGSTEFNQPKTVKNYQKSVLFCVSDKINEILIDLFKCKPKIRVNFQQHLSKIF